MHKILFTVKIFIWIFPRNFSSKWYNIQKGDSTPHYTLYSTVICSQDRSGAKNRFCNTVKCTHYQTPHFRPSFNAPFSFFFIGLRRRCRYCSIAKQNPAAHQDHCGRFDPGTSFSPRRLVW